MDVENLIVRDHLYVSGDMAGRALILAGHDFVQVRFDEEYAKAGTLFWYCNRNYFFQGDHKIGTYHISAYIYEYRPGNQFAYRWKCIGCT